MTEPNTRDLRFAEFLWADIEAPARAERIRQMSPEQYARFQAERDRLALEIKPVAEAVRRIEQRTAAQARERQAEEAFEVKRQQYTKASRPLAAALNAAVQYLRELRAAAAELEAARDACTALGDTPPLGEERGVPGSKHEADALRVLLGTAAQDISSIEGKASK